MPLRLLRHPAGRLQFPTPSLQRALAVQKQYANLAHGTVPIRPRHDRYFVNDFNELSFLAEAFMRFGTMV
jgi:hypothetical protein